MTFEQLDNVPRYLKALNVRIERASHSAAKDAERASQLGPFLDRLNVFETKPTTALEAVQEIAHFQFMVREFEVSLFAQEVGTAIPVSSKRLEKQIDKIIGLGG